MKKRKAQKKRKKPTIKFREELFWDVDVATIDPEKHKKYIIERMLAFGNDREIRWMWNRYSKKILRAIVKTSRVLHAHTKPLWLALTK